MISSITSNHIEIAGISIPLIFLIFAGAVLALIIAILVVSGVLSKKYKKKKRNEDVKTYVTHLSDEGSPDDGIYVANKTDRPVNKPTTEAKPVEEKPAIKEDSVTEPVSEVAPEDEEYEILEDDDDSFALVKDKGTADILTYIDKQAKGEQYSDSLVEEEVKDRYSDEDIENVFLMRGKTEEPEAVEEPEEQEEDTSLQEETVEEPEEQIEDLGDKLDVEEFTADKDTAEDTDIAEINESVEDSEEAITEEMISEETAPEDVQEEQPEELANEIDVDDSEDVLEEVAADESEEISGDLAEVDGMSDEDLLAIDAIREPDEEIIYDNDELDMDDVIDDEVVTDDEDVLPVISDETPTAESDVASDEFQEETVEAEEESESVASPEESEPIAEADNSKEPESIVEPEEDFEIDDIEEDEPAVEISEESADAEGNNIAKVAVAGALAASVAVSVTVAAKSKVDDDDDDDDEDEGRQIAPSKYKRSFLSKVVQSDDATKNYYSQIKNELLSYEKMRCSASAGCETFIASRKTYAKIAMSGKTLSLYLNLNPLEFSPSTFHHKDKSDNKKYSAVPMMVKVKSDLGMRKAISLIMTMMGDNGVNKNAKFKPVDYVQELPYKTDEELIAEGLIKYNMGALADVSPDITDEDIKEEAAYREQNNVYRAVAPVKKGKVGKTTQKDVNRTLAKSALGVVADERNRSEKGKFVVTGTDGEYRFTLYNPQGKDLFGSVTYKTLQAVGTAISDFIEAAEDEYNFSYNSLDNKYIFVLRGKSTFTSLPYATKISCTNAVAAIRESAKEAEIVQRQSVEG